MSFSQISITVRSGIIEDVYRQSDKTSAFVSRQYVLLNDGISFIPFFEVSASKYIDKKFWLGLRLQSFPMRCSSYCFDDTSGASLCYDRYQGNTPIYATPFIRLPLVLTKKISLVAELGMSASYHFGRERPYSEPTFLYSSDETFSVTDDGILIYHRLNDHIVYQNTAFALGVVPELAIQYRFNKYVTFSFFTNFNINMTTPIYTNFMTYTINNEEPQSIEFKHGDLFRIGIGIGIQFNQRKRDEK